MLLSFSKSRNPPHELPKQVSPGWPAKLGISPHEDLARGCGSFPDVVAMTSSMRRDLGQSMRISAVLYKGIIHPWE